MAVTSLPELGVQVHFVSLSKVLFWTGEERGVWGPGDLALREEGYLVFGGEVEPPVALVW